MTEHTTRRGFLGRTAAVATSGLLVGQLTGAARAVQPAKAADGEASTNAPLVVVTQSVSRDENPRAGSWTYITEILRRAGLFFESMAPSRLPLLHRRSKSIVLLAGNLPLTAASRQALAGVVKRGGWLIGIGGTSGLDEVFGVSGKQPSAEGWVKVTAREHPIVSGLRSSLHVFGGYAVKTGSATSLAELQSGPQGAQGNAVLENRFGQGRTVLLAPDLLFSIVHIQQGTPVLQDGRPAPDSTAAIDDGELKAEDGLVLDWQRDRTSMRADGEPAFLEPVSDELREIILRSIFHAAAQQGTALPMLWYWPRGLKAVGHISHDTDGNDPEKAVALLKVVNDCNLKSTWCTLYPGGYPKQFYRTLKKQGFEIALHYDARSGTAQTSWSKDCLLLQHRWLMKEAGLEHVTSNKNHYTRWESRLDFFRWCEQVGIDSDQTRGPSKKGTIGFPLGGCQPYFPLDDETDKPRLLNVLEVNMLTQDLLVVCPPDYGRQLVDSVLRHHGIAHFLFHPAHILKPHVADVFRDLVDYGRAQGLEWWTSAQIHKWEMARRGVDAQFDSAGAVRLRAAKPLSQATVLWLSPRPRPNSIKINGQLARGNRWKLYGFQFDAVTVDLAGEVQVQIA